MRDVNELARRHKLATHIDGARLFNAAVELAEREGGDPVEKARAICSGYDSVSVCLSKGLGAPVGSLLLGSKDFIREAKRARKMLGGGMRQAGFLAAAGLYALQNHVHRLAEDHANARLLAEGLGKAVDGHPTLAGKATVHAPNTNILFFDVDAGIAEGLLQHLAANDVRVTAGTQRTKDRTVRRMRWVMHLDVGSSDVERAVSAVASFR
jgi:threonine aldolase